MTETLKFNRTLIVAILLSGAFVTVLNQTLMLVAIPPIMVDFQIEASMAQWVTTAFLLTNGILIPITAFLMEKFTSRQLLISALVIFTTGTCLGAIAFNFPMLLLARVVQASGAGIMMPLMQTILLTIFPREKRGSAMGMVGLVIAFAPAIGPTLSGWVLDQYSWRTLFYIIIPIALLVIFMSSLFMKNVLKPRGAQIDVLSIILSSFGWGGLLYGFSSAGIEGWTSIHVLASLAVGSLTLFLFIWRQLRLESPILEFRVFQSRIFAMTTLLSVFVFALMIGTQTLLPLYIQDIRGLPAISSGLILLPGAVVMGFMSPIIGRIFDKFGSKWLAVTGFSLISTATIIFTQLQTNTSLIWISVVFTMLSFGLTMVMMPLMTAGINSLPSKWIAHGTAMNNTIRMVGGSIGTAMLVTVMSITTAAGGPEPSQAEQMHGLKIAFFLGSGIAIVGLLLTSQLKERRK